MITEKQKEKIELEMEECSFKDMECDFCHKIPNRLWFNRTNHEVEEGDYYCDDCAWSEISKAEPQSTNLCVYSYTYVTHQIGITPNHEFKSRPIYEVTKNVM